METPLEGVEPSHAVVSIVGDLFGDESAQEKARSDGNPPRT